MHDLLKMAACPPRARQRLSALTISVLATTYLTACMTWTPAPDGQRNVEDKFADALKACRLKEPGRMNRRLKTRPTELHVKRCLEARGWLPDGTPVTKSDNRSEADVNIDTREPR